MKNLKLTFILICILLFAISNLQAQAPEKINYQAVARNLAGNPLVNQAVGLEFNIRQGSPTGAVVYSETHTGVSTNQFGLFTAEIGGGTVNSGIFSAINWGLSSFYLQVTIDGNILPATQLLSVPFALYAKESANGPAGLPGKNSLSLSTPYTGPACINGGTQVDAGLDDNNDGTLQPLEIDYTYIICNGTNGTNGTNGLPGSNGVDGISIDSTINNNNGTFTIYYSNGTSFTTSDLTGPAGTNGTSGTTYFAGNGISLSGDTITNLGDLDNNPTNELQILSVSNDTIFLSNGGFAPLPSAGGFWTQLGGSIHNNNIGKVGIGTSTPIHQLSVASNDSVVASFLGTNPSVSAIVVANVNPNAATGIVFFNGTDTTSYIFLNPTTNTLAIRNNSVNGNIQISTDSVLVNQGLILVNQAQNSIYNQSDTIYSYSSSGEIINVNSGLFLTDSLYVLGSNATNTNWILANDGFGQAKWTDPSTIVGSVGDNWGSQVVIHDTTLTGTGIAGTPLSVNPNIIPTQTSQLTNNSGFITSPNDGDTSATNELQVLSFANDTLYLSNGNAIYLPPAAGDSWGSDSVITAGANISGSGTSANPLMVVDNDTSATNELQVLSFNNDTLYLSNGNAIYLPPAAGDSWGSDSVITVGANISGSGTTANPLMVFDNDTSATNELQNLSNGGKVGNNQIINISGGAGVTFSVADADSSATNEIQTLSLAGDTLSISGGNNVNLSTLSGTTYTAGTGINLTGDTVTNTAPDQTVVITGGGTTSVTSAYPNFTITTTDNDTSATNEIQNLSVTTIPGIVTLGISGGNTINFSVDDSPTNELITSFGVNGTNDSLVIKEAGNDWAVPLSSLSASANAWNLNGNTGTIVGTHFIGTGDGQPLMFKVNGNKAGFIDYDGSIANTGLGYQTLYSITSGTYNTAMGYTALRTNTTGNYNTAMGIAALYNNSTGSSNTAIGGSSLNGNLTGSFNTAIGDRSLQAVGNGSHNTAVGYLSLLSNSNAGQNVAIGSKSLYTQSFANGGTPYVTDNVAVGYQALYSNQPTGSGTDALRNIAVGSLVLYSNTTGLENTAIGHSALSANNTGLRNTANGAWALYNNTTGSYNVALGYLAGVTFTGANANITGNNNTFIGYASGPGTSTQLSNATAIGANALVMTSNTVQLGAGADIDFDRALMPNGNPGTSGYLLSSQGAGVAPIWVDPSTIGTSLWTDAGNTYLTSLTDNVGIGTNNPLSKLHIQGTSDPLEVVLDNGGGAFKTGYTIKTGAGQKWFIGKELTPDFVIKDETVGQVRLQIATNGNVGIGTTSPESMLHVALPNTANHKAFQLGHGNQPTLEWLFKVDEFSLFSIANENNGTEFTAMVIDANNGNVGIGTTTANSKLDVQNAANNVHAFSSIHTGTNAHAGYFQINNAANNLNAINATTNGAGAAINASNTYNGANAIRDGIYVTVTGTGGAGTVNKAGYFSAIGASNNYAAIFDQGNVGIGTGSPTEKLEVNGNFKLVNGSQANNRVLTSDAAGVATWTDPSSLSISGPWTKTGSYVFPTTLSDSIGIGTTTPTNGKLEVQQTSGNAIFGENTGANGIGVYGKNAAVGGVGVYGWAGGANGTGTYGYGKQFGVWGYGDDAGTGVYAYLPWFANSGRGLFAYAEPTAPTGTTYAVYALNSGTTANSYGIYSEVSSASAYAGYFVGGKNYFQGSVGIGVTPTSKLEVANSTLNNTAKIENTFNTNVQKEAVYGITSGSGTGANIGGKFEATGGSGSNYALQAAAYSNVAGATNYGVHGAATGTATNIGGFFRASGGSANYALIVPSGGGNVGIGTSTPTAGLDVNGTIVISGANTNELNRAQTGAANLVPIAYGNISGNATINATTGNFSVIWNGTNLWYEITITGEAYNNTNYIATITPVGGVQVTTATSTLGGKLLVVFNDLGGTKIQQAFQFIVYKP